MTQAQMTTLADKPTRHRYLIMLMIFVCVAITFLDRSNISITAPAMRKDLGFDTVHMGWILSAFGWTYAFCQIPSGWLVDRIRPRYRLLLRGPLRSCAIAQRGSEDRR